MHNALLASSSWILDLTLFLALLMGTALGAYRGFVKKVCKLAGKIASLIVAFLFCVSFANFLELCFHMTSAITDSIASSIAQNSAYAIALPNSVAGSDISAALAQIGIGAVPRWLIGISFANVDLIPAGTTPATLIASVLAKWISIVIAFVLLIILVRLGARLLSKSFDSIKNAIAPIRVADQFLGALLGFLESLVLIFLFLTICNWLPIPALHDFIGSGGIFGKIFASEWFQNAVGYAVSGKWFTQYLKRTG